MPEDTEPTAPDSDAPQEQPAQPMYPQIGAQVTPDGLVIQVVPAPVMVTIATDDLKAIARGLLQRDPLFAKELIEQAIQMVRAQQKQLEVVTDPKKIRHISRKRID